MNLDSAVFSSFASLRAGRYTNDIAKELVNQDWGKNFSIFDPDKNKVQFVEFKKDHI